MKDHEIDNTIKINKIDSANKEKKVLAIDLTNIFPMHISNDVLFTNKIYL